MAGKSTISMAIFNSYVNVYQRVQGLDHFCPTSVDLVVPAGLQVCDLTTLALTAVLFGCAMHPQNGYVNRFNPIPPILNTP
jgi:hypothetical protein